MGTKSIINFGLFRTDRKINKKTVGKRIKKIRASATLSAFGKKIGVAHTTIRRYETGMLPSAEKLLRIASLSGRGVEWLLTGRENAENAPLPPERLPEDEYLSVPLTEGKIAAGEPIIAQEEVIEWVVVHTRPIKKASAQLRNLVACRISGDSMWPQLADGDIVVIDRGIDKTKIQKRKIYAVWMDGGITAKLLQREGHRLFLIPINSADEVRTIDLRQNPSPVVGLVIGGWRNFSTL